MAIADLLLNKISRIGWYLKDVGLPVSSELSYINFCIHSEVIYDKATCEALLRFSKDFHDLTGNRITLCVTTPLCPMVRDKMREKGISEDDFRSNVLSLSASADIGYHGHFYLKTRSGILQVSSANYDKGAVCGQIAEEMSWFDNLGIRPQVYVAGWWFLKEDIILALENFGIKVDVSVRKYCRDTFGGKYLFDAGIPEYGSPFILPPSKDIVEIQSIFGPIMRPPIMKRHLLRYLAGGALSERFFIFPLHDWDVPRYYRNILLNVRELCKFDHTVRWMDVLKMRDICREKIRVNG